MIKVFTFLLIFFCVLSYSNSEFFVNTIYDDKVSEINYNQLHMLSEKELQYVAHAGGGLDDYTYLNNLESIRNSYNNGIRLIELDIEFTSDNKPIMLHSWDGFITKFFGVEAWQLYSYEEFRNFKMVNDWHQLTLDDTIFYMENEFKDMYLITDTKNDNKLLLDILITKYPHMINRIIPQVYNQDEYRYAESLGFKNIIYTLYMSPDTKEQVIEFCKQNKPFAITMPLDLAYTDLPLELSKLNIYTYTHTINDANEYKTLITNGIKGIYTDYLLDEI